MGSPPVTGTVLRSVRVQQALEHVMHGVEKAAHPILLSDGTVYELPYETEWTLEDREVLVRPKSRTVTSMNKKEFEEARLLDAARLHVIGEAFGGRSLKLVQDVLQVTQRSASRLIDKARERGLIEVRDADVDQV